MEGYMLTPNDYDNLLKLISSPRLQINGAEAQVVAMLQHKLQHVLKEAQSPIEGHKDGDDSGSPEQRADRTEAP